ncbi:MAG: ammonium transporter [Christensenellaceae bacterium]|jgi:Amt family ammonium transporter|nr:ammonium transporter [Christensenellaceae bacterium]
MFNPNDTMWVLLAAALVFFMQAGFAMVEAGLTRAKNTGNIIMKNLLDFCIGTVVFWFLGFGIMFGEDIGGLFGKPDLFTNGLADPGTYPPLAFLIFQTVFCATAATIVSGAMAERTKFISYCLYSGIISLLIYPITGHWIWGGGWLSSLGFHDFAGSTAVHMVGGVASFTGALVLGPRIGKYDEKGKPKAILGHNMALVALGVFILWFCWFGFNGGSTTSATGDDSLFTMSNAFVTTNLAAATATVAALIFSWVKYKKPDVSMTFNGALAGLVAVTAGADTVTPTGAFFIGLIAGLLIIPAIEFIDKKLKVDDPVGAIGVHGVCGAVGTILVGLFAAHGENADELGLFYGGNGKLFGVQILGVLVVMAFVGVVMFGVFHLLKRTVGLRVKREEELAGLDIAEHGLATSYAGFAAAPVTSDGISVTRAPATVDTAVKVEYHNEGGADAFVDYSVDKTKFTKIVIVANPSKFDDLKTALNNIGITGMTVTNVMGFGMQKGHSEYYRGTPMDVNLLPKFKMEIVVCKIPVIEVVNTAKKVLFTGNYGDGKIFVYDVENIIKIRTNEEGYDALQDD